MFLKLMSLRAKRGSLLSKVGIASLATPPTNDIPCNFSLSGAFAVWKHSQWHI
jgi:hypothetical protein